MLLAGVPSAGSMALHAPADKRDSCSVLAITIEGYGELAPVDSFKGSRDRINQPIVCPLQGISIRNGYIASCRVVVMEVHCDQKTIVPRR